MGFETVVLNRVAEVLGSGRHAEFICGTLFVEDITAEMANEIREALREMVIGGILVSEIFIGEYAFDFTA